MIIFESVSKVFPGHNGRPAVAALNGISMTVNGGEFVTIIGPSGSGKSTLLFTMGAMMAPSAGAVKLGGTDLYDLPAARRAELRRRHFGFVFQTFNLLPYLTCRDNVALPAILAGAPHSQARARAESLLSGLGLAERRAHRPAELSVGERQRVALCRSLVNAPAVLLADEPTGNLDPSLTDQVMDLLLQLHAQGQTIVLVTHNHRLAEVGTRVIELREGWVEADRPAGQRSARR